MDTLGYTAHRCEQGLANRRPRQRSYRTGNSKITRHTFTDAREVSREVYTSDGPRNTYIFASFLARRLAIQYWSSARLPNLRLQSRRLASWLKYKWSQDFLSRTRMTVRPEDSNVQTLSHLQTSTTFGKD